MLAQGPILVVGDDPSGSAEFVSALQGAGLSSERAADADAARAWLDGHAPSLVVIDLTSDAERGFELLAALRQQIRFNHIPMIVIPSNDADDQVERATALGADDFVRAPFRKAELLARIRSQLRFKDYVDQLTRRERDQQTALELTQALASSHDIRDILFTVVQRVASVARVDRCSIVLASEKPNLGYVVATSDDEHIRDLALDLTKYPEIREVLTTGKPLVIRDASKHPVMEAVRQNEPNLGFSSLALMPILHDHGSMGALFLRSRRETSFGEHEMSLVGMVASATAIALQNAKIFKSLRDETQQSTHARAEAEKRLQLFQRYADFIESAADGMVVIDREGKMLFANPRAREILGYSETELMNASFEKILETSELERARRLLRGFGEGVYPRGVDVRVRTKSDATIIISVSFSSVLHEDNAILLTFRDVSRERKTAVELKQTKEFLERVIDSSVDGIVSADLRGRVLLFNRAAARIFGYRPEDVIGKMPVDRLYPPGVAREIMRKIRDPEVGGYGHLEDYRVDMLEADGKPVPVTLSASLVMDNGRPVGSVGIFTDIRDQLMMEAQLEQAQEQLRTREKQALIAELAGAAAHELNQPLTSVIGYAELLKRSIKDDEKLRRAAEVIIAESERMAEIVRKVGKITKYETKNYVGGAKILDLEKATESEGNPSAQR